MENGIHYVIGVRKENGSTEKLYRDGDRFFIRYENGGKSFDEDVTKAEAFKWGNRYGMFISF